MPNAEHLATLLLEWLARHARDLPWRRTRDPYAIWVSEVMLQQTQVATVIPYWERWMRTLPDVHALARAPLDRVLKLWEGLGYYTRARHLRRAARLLVRRHGGQFPRDFAAVLALPGVGRYTAGALCSLAFNQPAPALDGNVTRVLARLLAVREDVARPPVRRRLWDFAEKLVRAAAALNLPLPAARSGEDWRARRVRECPCGSLNEALMELGATVCTPRQPRCECCPLQPHCRAHHAGLTAQLPRKRRSRPGRAQRLWAYVWEHQGRLLARRRPTSGANGRLWELPNFRPASRQSPLDGARSLLGPTVRAVEWLLTTRFAITRHRWEMQVFRVAGVPGTAVSVPGGRWLTASQRSRVAFAAAHRRVLDQLIAARAAGDSTTGRGGARRHMTNHDPSV